MIGVFYKFRLREDQVESYISAWNTVVEYLKDEHGALGSALHKGHNGSWIAYSRWPSLEVRDAAWSSDPKVIDSLPKDILEAVKLMSEISRECKELGQYEESVMEVVEDRFR